jgi:hypothetical protein
MKCNGNTMKKNKCILFFFLLLAFSGMKAQVQWSFTAKNTSDKSWELHCTAILGAGWHIYSQFTPDGGPIPTSFNFSANPLVEKLGDLKEIGKMDQHHEPLFGVDVKQFSNRVDFVQTVKLKAKIKTVLTGIVKYMLCNNSQCLPPKEQPFSISLK